MADLTSSEVGLRLDKDPRLIRLWCQQGRFPGARIDQTLRGPVWMIPESDLKDFQAPAIGRPKKQKAASKVNKNSVTIELQTTTTRKLNKAVKRAADVQMANKKTGRKK